MTMIFTYFTCVILFSQRLRNRTLHCFRRYPFRVFLGGAFLLFSNISYRYGLEITDVSYAAGVRQIATLFGVLMGVFLLKESYGFLRFLASLIIVLGIALIRIG
ncbi:EamA family transporter [Thermodesulfobacteriota bacterium]